MQYHNVGYWGQKLLTHLLVEGVEDFHVVDKNLNNIYLNQIIIDEDLSKQVCDFITAPAELIENIDETF